MWYDATSAAGSLEATDSPVKGKIGYAPAPVVKTKSSGWLYAWSWGIQEASKKKDNAWKFISWASSKEYEELVGEELGWSQRAGRQAGLDLREPRVLKEAAAFAEPTKAAIETADPTNPGVQPRPALGIQFVGIPEFPDLGHPGVAGRQLGDRRPDDASTRRWTRARSSPRTSPSATSPGRAVNRRAVTAAHGGQPPRVVARKERS